MASWIGCVSPLQDLMFHHDYVASFRYFKTSEVVLFSFLVFCLTSCNSHQWSNFHAFAYAALSAWSNLAHPDSSNSCPSLLVELLLIFQNPALRFPLGSPAPALQMVCCYIHFPWDLLPMYTSVSFSRLRAPWGQRPMSDSSWHPSWLPYCLELSNCSINASWVKK